MKRPLFKHILTLLTSVLITLGGLLFCCPAWALNTTLPNVRPEMLRADFWIAKLAAPEELLLDAAQIKAYQSLLEQQLPQAVIDLARFPENLSRAELRARLTAARFPEDPVYKNGRPFSWWDRFYIMRQLNLSALQNQNPVRYGFTVRRAEVRTFPTSDRLFDSPEDLEFDNWQESALDPATPLLILHQSRNRKWYLIQSAQVAGWLPAAAVAVTDQRQGWEDYLNAPAFLIVTAPQLRLGTNPFSPELSELLFEMGAKLPLIAAAERPPLVDRQSTAGNYVVKLPVRDAAGRLRFKLALIPAGAKVHSGFLAYTQANVLRQAFEGLGTRYGWGGMFNGMDCSAFVANVYRCFGIVLPRNSGDQSKIPGNTVSFETDQPDSFAARLRCLTPGALLHFNGHIMLYLGEENQDFYIIHDIAAYYRLNGAVLPAAPERVILNQVVVSDLRLMRKNAKSFWTCLDVGKDIRLGQDGATFSGI